MPATIRRLALYLVSDHRLLDARETLKRLQQARCVLRTPNQVDEAPQFLGQNYQNIILVLCGLCLHAQQYKHADYDMREIQSTELD